MAFPATSNWYRSTFKTFLERATNGPDIDTDTWKFALFTNSVDGSSTNNYDTTAAGYDYAAAPWTSNEVANANGYTTGGATVALSVVVGSAAGGGSYFIRSNAASVWTLTTAGSWTARGGLLYDSSTASAVKWGLAAINFGSDQTPSGSGATLTVTWGTGSPFNIFTIG